MAITNHERVGKALDLLQGGLAPFVERELQRPVRQVLDHHRHRRLARRSGLARRRRRAATWTRPRCCA